MRSSVLLSLALSFGIFSNSHAIAQAPASPPAYGAPITLEQAKAAVAAAEAEATKNGWNMVLAVVGPYGNLIYFQKADLASNASIDIAQDKARTAALFRVPSKAYMDRLAKGETYVTSLRGVTPVAGGVPIVVSGKVIGAIGASGGSADQDHSTASAGAAAVK
jgi:glc operon protein GlcG